MSVRTPKGKGDDGTRPPHPSPWAAELAAEFEDELVGMPLELAIKHLPAVPTVDEVRRLLACAQHDAAAYLVLRLLYYTGVRRGELEALCFAHASYDGETLFVVDGKGDKDRYVCVDAESLALIRERQGERPLSDRIVGFGKHKIWALVRKYGLKNGLVQKYEGMGRRFSPHSLRHAFATHRYDAGLDLFTLKKLLGHDFLTTTLIYVETSMRHARERYRNTDPLSAAGNPQYTRFDCRPATTDADLAAAFAIRERVFIQEQQVPFEEERDAADATALHVLVFAGDEAAGTARLVVKPDGVGKIGRVAVLPPWRGKGLGVLLVRTLEKCARERGLREVILDAQANVVGFYEKLGYVAEGDLFEDAGIMHRCMRRAL